MQTEYAFKRSPANEIFLQNPIECDRNPSGIMRDGEQESGREGRRKGVREE